MAVPADAPAPKGDRKSVGRVITARLGIKVSSAIIEKCYV